MPAPMRPGICATRPIPRPTAALTPWASSRSSGRPGTPAAADRTPPETRRLIRQALRQDEGYRETVYQDRGGLAVGYGSQITEGEPEWGLKPGDPLPGGRERANELFDLDFERTLEDVRTVMPGFDRGLPPAQTAFLSMAYQMGRGGLAGFHRMRAAAVREQLALKNRLVGNAALKRRAGAKGDGG